VCNGRFWNILLDRTWYIKVLCRGDEFWESDSPSGSLTLNSGQLVNQFQEFSPPTIFKIGFAFEPIMDDKNMLTTSIQLNHPNDNSENICLGAEYSC